MSEISERVVFDCLCVFLDKFHPYSHKKQLEAMRAALTHFQQSPEWQALQYELSVARKRVELYQKMLGDIYALLGLDDCVLADGRRFTFSPQDPTLYVEAWKELSRRIRAIPDAAAAVEGEHG